MNKKIISVLVSAALLLSLCILCGCGDKDKPSGNEGTEENPWLCGATEADDVRAFMMDDALWITGEGRMADYESLADRPWDSIADSIGSVSIFDVASIGKNAFSGLGKNAEFFDVGIFAPIVSVGEGAFENVSVDPSCILTLPESTESIGSRAFAGSNFTEVYLYSVPEIAPDAFDGVFADIFTVGSHGWNEENRLSYGGELNYRNLFIFSYVEDYGTDELSGEGSFYIPEDETCLYNADPVDENYHFVRYEVSEGSLDIDPNDPEIETMLTGDVSVKVIFEKNAE